jgi:hypothetical protein
MFSIRPKTLALLGFLSVAAIGLTGHGAQTIYTDQALYLADLTAMGYVTASDGFEDDNFWGLLETDSAPEVTSQGMAWTGLGDGVTLRRGIERSGDWGLESTPAGWPSDGFIGTGRQTIYGIGGWIRSGNTGAGGANDLLLFLDGSENQVLDTLESAYDKLDQYLSLRPRRRIDVVIYDPQLFDAQFAGMFRFAAAGFYSGTIHIRGDVRVHQSLVGTLHHELVHAAFDAEAPSLGLPAWFNEGVSEWFEARSIGKRQLSVRQFRALSQNAAAGTMFGLAQLSSRSFGGFGQEAAQLAYLQSYAFIDYLSHEYGERSLRGLVATLLRKRDLSRAFETTYHRGLPELEAGFVAHYLESAGG